MCPSHGHRKEAVEQDVIGVRDGNEALLHDAGIVDDDIVAVIAPLRFCSKALRLPLERKHRPCGSQPAPRLGLLDQISASAAWPA